MRLGFLVSTFAFWGMIVALAVAGATSPGAAPAGSNDRVISAEELAEPCAPGRLLDGDPRQRL